MIISWVLFFGKDWLTAVDFIEKETEIVTASDRQYDVLRDKYLIERTINRKVRNLSDTYISIDPRTS